MDKKVTHDDFTAKAYLRALKKGGIDHVFANAGTDFAPVIEALVDSERTGDDIPRFVTVPHENVAVSMAHGLHRVTGKPSAVMVHVNVGTANALCALMNASRDGIPLLLAAGRTPLTETGNLGSRNGGIHWGQENFDQAAMLREYVKWDFELRARQPVELIVGRALDIAMSEPRGPVYLSLPREVLGSPTPATVDIRERAPGSEPAAPSAEAIAKAADIIANADFPLILTSFAGRSAAGVKALEKLAKDFAIPVVQPFSRDMNISIRHPMHFGSNPGPMMAKADVIVVIDSEVPWIPSREQPGKNTKVIHFAADPLFSTYPVRGFQSDLAIAGASALALALLAKALRAKTKAKAVPIERRRKALAELRRQQLDARAAVIEKAKTQTPIHPAWMAHCINQVKSKDTVVVNELGVPPDQLDMTEPLTYMAASLAGGLGFGLGAALGAKLGRRGSPVIAVVGDGSYMFGNPMAAHQAVASHDLPMLFCVFNNSTWFAVRRATLDVYPDGYASKSNRMPLTMLEPSPHFEKMMDLFGGYGEKVERAEELPAAFERALHAVRVERRQALLNIIVSAAW
jgi:acetolactate synthase-1/2/3 large subunit